MQTLFTSLKAPFEPSLMGFLFFLLWVVLAVWVANRIPGIKRAV
jgi:hypothetical protein